MATVVGETDRALPARGRGVAVIWQVISSTLVRAWRDRVLGLAAEAGFWQLLSLPSMLLGIVGIIGFFSGSLGTDTIHDIENALLRGAKHVIVPSAVDSTVKPALDRILAGGRADAEPADDELQVVAVDLGGGVEAEAVGVVVR